MAKYDPDAFGIDQIILGPAGTKLLYYTGQEWAKDYLRIYDRHWRPMTPLLQVNISFDSGFSTVRDGFIAWGVIPRRHNKTTDEWAHIGLDGAVRKVAVQPAEGDRPQRLRKTDVPLPEASSPAGRLAYRPSRDQVFVWKAPSWAGAAGAWWTEPDGGAVCAYRTDTSGLRGDIMTSTDEGRTWIQVPTSAIGLSMGATLGECSVTHDQVTIITGNEEDLLGVHTLNRHTGALLASHRLGYSLDPYGHWVLHDGTLITGTNRHGVMAGATPSNFTLEFRRAPAAPYLASMYVVGREMISDNITPGWLWITTDAATTWRKQDLSMRR